MDEQCAREMERLESDIVQVHELFATLATYVHDQGTVVNSIEENIEVAYEKVSRLVGSTRLAASWLRSYPCLPLSLRLERSPDSTKATFVGWQWYWSNYSDHSLYLKMLAVC